jgi:hypothetical protein
MVVLQIAGAVELQVTCPFVVPFNQASQVQTFPALKHLAYLLAKTPFSLLVQVAWHIVSLKVCMIINSPCKAQLRYCMSHKIFIALACPTVHWHSMLMLHATAHARC